MVVMFSVYVTVLLCEMYSGSGVGSAMSIWCGRYTVVVVMWEANDGAVVESVGFFHG